MDLPPEKATIEIARELAHDLVREMLASKSVRRAFDRLCATRLAVRLFEQHWRRNLADRNDDAALSRSQYGIRAEMRDRLMTTYKMSRASAYRCIDDAMQIAVARIETSSFDNAGTDTPEGSK
jgi:hypothetical protein